HGGAALAAVRPRPDGGRVRHLDRRHHGVLRRDRRPGAERHQAHRRLFDLLPARLHVRRHGRGRLFGRHVPFVHPRFFQGAAIPLLGLRDYRDASRAGYPQDGRPARPAAGDLRHHGDRHLGAHRLPAPRRLFLQGRHHRSGLRRQEPVRALRLRADRRRRGPDRFLFLAADLQDLPRARPRLLRARPCSREPGGDDRAAHRACGGLDPRRLPVQGDFRRAQRRGILPRVGQTGAGSAGGHAPRADSGRPAAHRDDGDRASHRLAVLHPPSRPARFAGEAARRALPLPAQQVVLRRNLRLPVRASRVLARPAAVEGRRRLADRRLRPRRRVGTRDRCDQPRDPPPERLPLSLRLRHADRRRRAHHLVHVCRGALMTSWPILSLTVCLPLLGALLIILMARGETPEGTRNARWIPLWTTLVTFAVSLILVWRFDPASPEFQFVEKGRWLAGTIGYHMGVDGISLPFVIRTTGLMPICIIASWEPITRRVKEYMIAFLVLESLMVGTFASLDLVLFYLFFEGGLIPMFLIIGVWGGPRRVYATFKFFLYTFLGSVLMLLAIMAMYWQAGTTDIPTLMGYAFPLGMQKWLWLPLFPSLAVKLPMWPVHTWLPDAHVEAPTAGSVILAAILLKMGGYGFLRFSLPMFPAASHDLAPLIFALSVVAVVYTSLVALMQEDMKKLIAYSSVAH